MIRIVLAQTVRLDPARRVHPWLIFVGVIFGVGAGVFVCVLVQVIFFGVGVGVGVGDGVIVGVVFGGDGGVGVGGDGVGVCVCVCVGVLAACCKRFFMQQQRCTANEHLPPWYRFLCRILHKSRETYVS